MIFFHILLGKFIGFMSSLFNIGSGSTWPGHIALENDKNFIKNILNRNARLKIILIAGTNGKTTTGKLIQTILEENGNKVFQNEAGANLLNGIASTLIKRSTLVGKISYDFAVFEIDENSLPLILNNINPEIIILLNLFRDQLDRYGEVNIISEKWKKSLEKLNHKSILIFNADDPRIAQLVDKVKNQILFFGVKSTNKKRPEHASDSSYCPNCGNRLNYKSITFSHLGDWICVNCGLKKPKANLENLNEYPLPGLYNKYNSHAAALTAKTLGISDEKIKKAFKHFKPAFGRQEVIEYKDNKIQIFLSKNPASFNQSLIVINELKAKNLLIILNDRIPDGRDVSWIWDVDFENNLKNFENITVSGDRAYDMALRLQYANNKSQISNRGINIYENLRKAVDSSLMNVKSDEIYILPTYSAMLDLRKILTGKKIL